MTTPTPEPTSVEAQLAVINVKLDLLLVGRDDHEARLRTLEKFKWQVAGAAAALGGATGAAVDKFFV